MRFDDSLRTVLAADRSSASGAQAAWRQLVDLAGRGRIAADAGTIERLRVLRAAVPQAVRAASGRALAFARPPAALVALFAEDEPAVAAPVLRTVTLPTDAWLSLLPLLTPAGRAVLRGRRDLNAEVDRGLESFGSTDFALADRSAPPPPANDPAASAAPPVAAPLSPTPFVALGEVALGLPAVAAALRDTGATEAPATAAAPTPRFEIADIVARIDAFQRQHRDPPTPPAPVVASAGFRFATDAAGTIRWVEGVARAALVGVSLATSRCQGLVQVDGAVAGAVRRRGRVADARLEVAGTTDAAGSWRIVAVPDFDAATGRFAGYRGSARRPARHERAEPRGADQLRQLVHELRTPANAVSGFAELIETQLLGPVADADRVRAGAIRAEAGALLAAIEDLDTAARIEGGALDLRPGEVPLAPLIDAIVGELRPLAQRRGAALAPGGERLTVAADAIAVERLVARLLSALLAAAGPGERIALAVAREGGRAAIALTRPATLVGVEGDALLALDDGEDAEEGAPLLGIGFTLRLARNLARELGGTLDIGAERLTLRLPLAFTGRMDRTTAS